MVIVCSVIPTHPKNTFKVWIDVATVVSFPQRARRFLSLLWHRPKRTYLACPFAPRLVRTLLVAPGRTTRNKKLLVTKGIATRNKDSLFVHHRFCLRLFLANTVTSCIRMAKKLVHFCTPPSVFGRLSVVCQVRRLRWWNMLDKRLAARVAPTSVY